MIIIQQRAIDALNSAHWKLFAIFFIEMYTKCAMYIWHGWFDVTEKLIAYKIGMHFFLEFGIYIDAIDRTRDKFQLNLCILPCLSKSFFLFIVCMQSFSMTHIYRRKKSLQSV